MSKPDNKSFSYDEAYTELNSLLKKIEQNQAGIDELSVLIDRASELLSLCRQKLRQAENTCKDSLENLDNQVKE